MSAKHELVTSAIVPRIKAVLTAAEQTAAIVAEEAETEAGRRAAEILAAAEVDANRIRYEATRRVEDYLTASRRRVDAFATARIERITELTDGVIEAAQSIQERLEQATLIQRQVHGMIEALGGIAEAVASEAAQASPTLPQPPTAPGAATANGHGPAATDDAPDGEGGELEGAEAAKAPRPRAGKTARGQREPGEDGGGEERLGDSEDEGLGDDDGEASEV